MSERILFVDASAGASGDMILGALVDLGAPAARLRRELASLPIEGWTLRSRAIERCALAGRKIDVRVRGRQPGRGWNALRRIVAGGDLPTSVRKRALAIFRRLIEAEAEAHGSTPARVHLHEAGGTDAIIDVVGACIALELLGIDRIQVSTMTTGYGSIACAHGDYPVPGPATLLLTRGFPVRAGEIEAERLTPTGAAILTTLADDWGEMPAMVPSRVAYGAGDRDLGRHPNMLRMVLGTPLLAAEGAHEGEVVVLECDVDDATPQELAWALDCAREAGALDVSATPLAMKKGRLGQRLTVLVRPGQVESLAALLLRATGSLGLRYRSERRIELQREFRRVRTPYGTVEVKLGLLAGKVVRAWPEYETCATLARRRGVPLREIQQAALAALRADKPGRSKSPR